MTSPAPLPIETLLQHRRWMHALARRLVQDDVAADDVMQETWLASLRTPPRRAESVRGWLSRVVRSKAADNRRARRAVGGADRVHALASGAPSVTESVAEAELHRRVSELMLGLDAPYRDVLVLRFFDGLPPREVAARLGCPVETVRTRTRRALGRLRVALDARHDGDRRAWVTALVPLARLDRGTTATAGGVATLTGVAVMTTKTKIGIAAVMALAFGLGGGWLAGAAAGDDDGAAERALAALTMERDAARSRADELASRLSEREERTRARSRELDDARTTIATLEEEVARLSASLEQADAGPAPPEAGGQLQFAAYADVLSDIDWDEVGLRTSELVKLLVRLREAIDTGQELAPETITDMQNKNAPLIAAAARVAGQLPGVGMNGPFASPPFMSNLIAATLRSGGAPLSEAQLRELDRLATTQLRSDEERDAGYDATTLELQKLRDEIASRTRFFDDASALLTAEQNAILRPESVRDIANLDLFSPAIQWGQFVRPISHNGTRGSVAQGIYGDLLRMVQPGEEHQAEVLRMVDEWAEQLPDDVLESERDALARLMMYDGAQVARTADHVLALYDAIRRTVPLEPDAQERLRTMPAPPVLLKR